MDKLVKACIILMVIGITGIAVIYGLQIWLTTQQQQQQPASQGNDTQLIPANTTAAGPGSQDSQSQAPVVQAQILSYTGNLTSGSSYFHGSQALCEFTFQDGRTFTATEQMARQANMKIGTFYRVSFNSSAPNVAITIQEEHQ